MADNIVTPASQLSKEEPAQGLSSTQNKLISDVASLFGETKKLGEEIKESIKRSGELNEEIRRTKITSQWTQNLLYLGFAILLFTLAFIMINVLSSQISSSENLTNQINQLNVQLQKLNGKLGQ
jgi:hypothetical protein